jgi:glycosyltransferase involved in cell wall biosynthesis
MGRGLRQHGVDVLIASTDADGERRLPLEPGVPVDWHGVPTIVFPRQFSESFKYSAPLADWLGQHVRDFSVVHINAVFSHACLAAASACRRHQVPYIVRPLGSLDPWSLRQKPLRKRLAWHLGAKQMLSRAAAIHYTTPAEQRLAEEPLHLEHGVVIPIGIDLAVYQQPADVAGFRSQFGLTDEPYVVILGRLHPKKGLEPFIRAFLDVTRARHLQHWRLVIVGDGDATYVERLKRVASESGDPARVVLAGWLGGQSKIAALQGAELLALPSFQENFGLVVAEALACGVPVLVSPFVNLADDIEREAAGWVVPLDDAQLAAGLHDALGRPDERARRGAAGRELANRFVWPTVTAELAGVYRQLAPADVA